MLQRVTALCGLLVLASAAAAWSQDHALITGQVLSQDGEPMVSASLILQADSGAVRTATADASGTFRFPEVEPGRYRVFASHPGFSPIAEDIDVTGGQVLTLQLPLLSIVEERVMVVGHASNLPQVPGSAYLLDESELETLKLGHGDIHTLLRQAPGVNIQEEEGYGLRPNIGMRGTGTDRSSKITLMEDGVLVAPAPYAAPAAYYFPTAARMEALEVRKGSSQIKHGPRTNGGVLNLISSSIPGEFRMNGNVSGGTDDTRRIGLKFGDTYDHFGWLVETYQFGSDGFKQLDGGGGTGFDLEDYMAKLRFNTSPEARVYQTLEIKLGKTDQRANETYLGLTDADFSVTPLRRYAASQEDLFDSAHRQYQATHLLAVPSFDLTTVIYRNDFQRDWFKLQSIDGIGIGDVLDDPRAHFQQLAIARGADSAPGALALRHNNREYYGAGVQSVIGVPVFTARARHDIEIGIRYHQDEEDRFQWEDDYQMVQGQMRLTGLGTPGSQSNRVNDARAWAMFAQDTLEWGRWTFVPGLRYESIDLTRVDYSRSDPGRTAPTRVRENHVSTLIPGIGMSFAARPSIQLFGGVHRGFSPPGPGSADFTRLEESINYELGVRAHHNALRGELVSFFNDYDNLLGTDTLSAGGSGEGDLFNGGKARALGFEALASWDPGESLGLRWSLPARLSYTFTDAEFRNSFRSTFEPWGTVEVGDALPYIPRHQLFASIGVSSATWFGRLDAVYAGAMRTVAGQDPVPLRESYRRKLDRQSIGPVLADR